MNRLFRAIIIITLLLAASLVCAQVAPLRHSAAQQTTPTTVPLQFPTATFTQGPPTETPTRTPTSAGAPRVEALANDTNIRAGPDITEARLGVIFPGAQYTVLGKRFQWYWIEVPEIPGGRAWVHESVAQLIGDEAAVPILDELPTADAGFVAAQQTALAISATPGIGATLTAELLITPTGVFTAAPGAATLAPGQSLPTFTPPPYSPTPVVFPRENPAPAEAAGLAPIVPILALGALGMMGILVAFLRRL